MSINKLKDEICELGYELLIKRAYEQSFAANMIPKIWMGKSPSEDCDVPPSYTLVFDKN